MSDVNRILSAIAQGDPHALEQLLPLVYDELRKLAAEKMAREMPGQTLQAARKAYGYMPGHGRFPYQNHWLTCRAAIGKGWGARSNRKATSARLLALGQDRLRIGSNVQPFKLPERSQAKRCVCASC